MKNYLRIFFALLAMMLCVGLMAACGATDNTDNNTNAPANNAGSAETDPAADETVPFVAPPDQIGKVVSPDNQLITWLPYAVEEDTIDFKGVKVNELGEPGEMDLLYLEREVSYFILVDGKMEETTADSIVKDAVIGVTTLEEGVQEIYILDVPVEEEDLEDVVDFDEEVTG